MTEAQEHLLESFARLVGPYSMVFQPNVGNKPQVAHLATETAQQAGATRRQAGDLLCLKEQVPGPRTPAPATATLCSRCGDVARRFVLHRKDAAHTCRAGLATVPWLRPEAPRKGKRWNSNG